MPNVSKFFARVAANGIRTVAVQRAIAEVGHRLTRELIADPAIQNTLVEIGLRVVHEALESPDVQRKLWKAINLRPADDGSDYAALRVGDVERTKYDIATRRSAELALEHFPNAPAFATPVDLLRHVVAIAQGKAGIFAEFGVFQGGTINVISSLTRDRTVHGFDSFQGLPEDWRDCGKGAFTTHGKLPPVNENVELHVGLFDQTLPAFLENCSEPAAFIHIDSDLYSSAKYVLDRMKARIEPGTVILFDEFFNYPNYEDHEYKAFFEFVKETGCSYHFLGYSARSFAVAVQIDAIHQT
jgi:hypothetical protein